MTCRLYIFSLTEMIEDWTVNYKPDLLTFVPYEWSFNIVLRDFEMVWLGNQHNWIECTSNRQDNGMMHTIDFFWKIVIVLLQNSSMIAHIRFICIILTCKTPFLSCTCSIFFRGARGRSTWYMFSLLYLLYDWYHFVFLLSSWAGFLWRGIWLDLCSSILPLHPGNWGDQVLLAGWLISSITAELCRTLSDPTEIRK